MMVIMELYQTLIKLLVSNHYNLLNGIKNFAFNVLNKDKFARTGIN